MPQITAVGFSGNITRPSKTHAFVSHIVSHFGGNGTSLPVFDIEDLGPSFPSARSTTNLDAKAAAIVNRIVEADLLVVGSPTFKGSYTGLFKHFFDLIDPAALRGKPVILTATGGGDRHSLMVEHQLRPLFGFFEALTMPTAIYASDQAFLNGVLVSEPIRLRVEQAVAEARLALAARRAGTGDTRLPYSSAA